MQPGLHRSLLRVFRLLPVGVRRLIVRVVSPSYTVGSMCFIERADGALLLVQHVYRHRWGVPGGLVQRREDVSEAARRETFEEVGLSIVLVGEPAVVVSPVPQRVDVVFRARLAPGVAPEGATPSSPEISRVGWFAPGDLPELQHETAVALTALARARGAGVPDDLPGVGRDR